MKNVLALFALALLMSGCASYTWKSSVPKEMRTVQVPTFVNKSDVTETGAVVTRQILREFQREGTFSIVSDGGAVEVQGEVVSCSGGEYNYNRNIGGRLHGGMMRISAKVSLIDKVNGRVAVDNRMYVGEASYSATQDETTALRDAAGRAADDLAQKIVNDVLKMKFVRKAKGDGK